MKKSHATKEKNGTFGINGVRDQTEAELDALIAQQMQNLPAWWKEESCSPT